MPRGGPRPNAGRPPGRQNDATIELREKAAAQGVMPVDILMDVARYHFAQALKLRHKRPRKAEDKAKVLADLRTEHALATSAADKAAPYYSPKLATLQSNVNLTGRLTLEALVEQSMALPPPANENAQLMAPVDEKIDAAE